jgi:hypothetical protein
MDESLRRVENSDFSGVEYLYGAFGGMGSFNDLVIARMNGHAVADADYVPVNNRLDRLRGELYELVGYLRRHAEIRRD